MNYKQDIEIRYNKTFEREYTVVLDGRTAESAMTAAERQAQHTAMLVTFTEAYRDYRSITNAAAIWNAIYSAHLRRKAGVFDSSDLNEEVIGKIISGAQSWKKCSGHVFEHFVVSYTKERLQKYNIRFILQKDLTAMLHDNQIMNEPEDQIPQMAQSDNFDIYAVVAVNGNNLVFGCVQAKTSIRDRVGRDRDFSIPAMQRHFWSVAVVLDGGYLSMPKFTSMVNGGGTTQYVENGWHGMYSMSNANACDRIYRDENLEILIQHANEAAQKFTAARQRFDRYWKAINGLEI